MDVSIAEKDPLVVLVEAASASASPSTASAVASSSSPSSPLRREQSFKDRENFGDVESEADDSGRDPHASSVNKTAVRTIRRSRSSRTNSSSDGRVSVNRLNSASPDGEAGGLADRSQGENGLHSSSSSSSELGSSPAPSAASDDHVGGQTVKKRHHHPQVRTKPRRRKPDGAEANLRAKLADIDRALFEGNVERLRELAFTEDGLLDDEVRRRAWPVLANVPQSASDGAEALPTQEECEKHPEYNQVVLDVNRSLKRFPPGIRDEERPGLQDQLTRLIVRVLIRHGSSLHYYQGYHDVAITFLLVVGEEMGYHIMQRLTLTHLKEFMAPTMERTTFLLNYIYPIIERESPELHDFLESSEVGTIFALPWLITWFGHVLPDYEDVVRLYDFFLSRPPLMPVYLAAALVLHREHEVLLAECDMAMVHGLLSRIPGSLPFEKLLGDAQELYDSYPPKTLESEVEDRYERLKEEYKMRGRTIKEAREAGLGIYAIPVVAGAVAVGAPVLIGVALWKWYNSS